MGNRAGLDGCVKSRPHRDSISDHPALSQSLYRLSYWAHRSILRLPANHMAILHLSVFFCFMCYWSSIGGNFFLPDGVLCGGKAAT